ncbi:hypothetical protein C8R47DRAFT_588336 [Mycena vitilis]|nr:hypothetical protein C8R47DRAFT_588336 [Mycena vitilis]
MCPICSRIRCTVSYIFLSAPAAFWMLTFGTAATPAGFTGLDHVFRRRRPLLAGINVELRHRGSTQRGSHIFTPLPRPRSHSLPTGDSSRYRRVVPESRRRLDLARDLFTQEAHKSRLANVGLPRVLLRHLFHIHAA